MAERPSGTVTFLFTDVEGSTGLWAADGEAMASSLQVHDGIVRSEVESRGGYVFTTAGDSFAVAFSRASDAVAAAVGAQAALAAAEWPGPQLRVRMGLHLGEAVERGGDYFGPVVNLTARLEAAGHGGQVLTTVQVRTAADVDAIDLGEHGLRDVPEPVRVFQVGAGEFPPLRVVASNRTNLPASRTRLLGRDDVVRQVRDSLRDHRLVTVTAGGGVGKTRLALAVGEEELPHWSGGVWFVDLLPVADGSQVVSTVAAVLGLDLVAGNATAQVAEYLGGLEALVVLDNCEHVVDACADLAEALLERPGSSVVLATSREPLDVDGERAIRLGPLGLDDPSAPAVSLFIERALALDSIVDPDVDRDTILELCRRLDGVPLAIELAAARSDILSPAELLEGIADRFELLAGGRRRSRRTLEDVLDWSYDLLDADEQHLLRHLGAFVGGFDLDAAKAVAGTSSRRTVDLLQSLIAKSLVIAERDGSAVRFRLLETTAAYAQRRLFDAGEAHTARDRHLDHHLELFAEFDVGLFPDLRAVRRHADHADLDAAATWAAMNDRWHDAGRLQFAGSSVLLSRRDEHRTAIQRCRAHLDGTDAELELRLAILDCNLSVQLEDWVAVTEIAMECCGREEPGWRAVGLFGLAFLSHLFDPGRAKDLCDQAALETAQLPDGPGRSGLSAWIHIMRGQACSVEGDHVRAREELRTAERLVAGDGPVMDALLQARLGLVGLNLMLGDPADARAMAEAIHFDSPYFGKDDGRALAAVATGDLDTAIPLIRRHAADAASGRLSRRASDSLLLLAWLAVQQGDEDLARELCGKMGSGRVPIMIFLGLHLARQLDAETGARLDAAALEQVSPEAALADLRAELARRGWTS